jgi:2-dehydro-3-deoxy-D-arabinonate dehydratase
MTSEALMQLAKVQLETGEVKAAIVRDGEVELLRLAAADGKPPLDVILHAADPRSAALDAIDTSVGRLATDAVDFLAPLDRQEVWAAGVTYKRSMEARERESVGAAQFYDLVYSAPRPELFFKAPAWRVRGPGQRVHIRRDSKWSVPEPELALIISPQLKLIGFTIGNDMSARDIEGENPLYLPQAKFYDHCCAVGPAITLVQDMPAPEQTTIRLAIERGGRNVFEGGTSAAAMKRGFDELIDWLGRETRFPHGAVLLTGTGVVPPDEFSLAAGDIVHIDVAGIGRLTNIVGQRQE